MEEILSSIKRIIAEDGDDIPTVAPKTERRFRAMRERDLAPKAAAIDLPVQDEADDDILELTQGVATDDSIATELEQADEAPDYVAAVKAAAPASPLLQRKPVSPESVSSGVEPAAEPPVAVVATASIVSQASEAAARSSLAALSSMLVKPTDEKADNTLEGLVREMLRPVLKEWLDAHLPELVEGMVAKEIARITGRPL